MRVIVMNLTIIIMIMIIIYQGDHFGYIMVILRVFVMRMTMIIIMMLIIRLSPSAQVSDDEGESDGQGPVYGDAETQKAVNKSVMMMMKVKMKALRMGGGRHQ